MATLIMTIVGMLYFLSYLLPSEKGRKGAYFLPSYKLLSPRNDGITVDGVNRLSEANSRHTLVLGQTGSSKTQTILLPSILHHAEGQQGSLIILDPKAGEIQRLTAGYFSKQGYVIKVLDFGQPGRSLLFNPLSRISTDAEIRQLASHIYSIANKEQKSGDPFWSHGATHILYLLISCIKQMPKRYQTLSTLNMILGLIEDDSPKLPYIFSTYAPSPRIKDAFLAFMQNDLKVRLGFIATAQASLSQFVLDDILRITQTDTFDMEVLRTRKSVVYLNLPVGGSEPYYAMTSLFFTQLFRFLILRKNTPDQLPLYLYLEELGNYKIPELEKYIALLRSNAVHFVAVLQNLPQLDTLYGATKAKTIVANCSNILCLPGTTDHDTTQFVLRLLGEQHKESLLTGKSSHQKMMTPFQLRTMKKILYLPSDAPPIKCNPVPLYKNKTLMKRVGLESRDGSLHPLLPYEHPLHDVALDVPLYSFESFDEPVPTFSIDEALTRT